MRAAAVPGGDPSAPGGETRRAGGGGREERAGQEKKTLPVASIRITSSQETGLVLIDAGCREEERGRRVGEGRGGLSLVFAVWISGWGTCRLYMCECLCVCVCVVSSGLCVSMMSVVSVSTGEGGVAADVVASVVAPLPEAIGTQRGEANERGRLTGLNSEESRSERISESASHAETRGSPPLLQARVFDVCFVEEAQRGEQRSRVRFEPGTLATLSPPPQPQVEL